MNYKEKTKKKEKGITLIALVITIIVLVILSATTLNAVYNSHIVEYASNGATEYADESIKENEILEGTESLLDDTVHNVEDISKGNTIAYAKNSGNTFANTTELEDSEGKIVTIPGGFKVSSESPTNANEGIIIEDEKGNQFVWVPVASAGLSYERHTYSTAGTDDTSGSTADSEGWRTYHYTKYSDWEEEGGNSASVEKYGGFYIGRYEAGFPETAGNGVYVANEEASNGQAYVSGTTHKNNSNYVPVSKYGAPVWNFITQANSKVAAEKMYEGSTTVDSVLMDSYAWDTVTNWIANTTSNSVTNSTNWGNYYNSNFTFDGLYAVHTYTTAWTYASSWNYGTGVNKPTNTRYELATGVSGFSVKNIYDFAGNVYEWTTETGHHGGGSSATKYAVLRGGSFYNYGASYPASYRYGRFSGSTTANVDIGFRVLLYII